MIAVVGAGITGLVLAHELAKRGLDFTVIEAAPEPGGVIRTVCLDGHVLELGPQRTRLTPGVRALIEELGLDGEVVTAPAGLPLHVYRARKLRRVPFTPRDALTTDLISLAGKVRVLFEPFTGAAHPDESVAAFLTRKFGREAYENLLGPLYGGLYASDPADMSMGASLSRALDDLGIRGSLLAAWLRRAREAEAGAPACSFRRGMRTLTDALHAAYHDRIRLDEPILAVHPASHGYTLTTPAGDIACDRVVLTTPADVSAGLLVPTAPHAAARLQRLTYNPLAVVHLQADCPIRAMGFQVAFGERLATRGVTFNACLFDRKGTYTAYLGGAADPGLVRSSDPRLGGIAADEFELATGCPARPLHVARVRMPAWDRSWIALEGLRLPAGIHLAANYESRAGIPGRIARARQAAAQLAGAGPD